MSESAYKVLFASEWTWPALLVTFVYLVPESPYDLVQKEKIEAATKSLSRLQNRKVNFGAILADIVALSEDEKATAVIAKETSYRECFRGPSWRRTRIILYANGLSQMIGVSFIANGPYFVISAGMSPTRMAMMIELGIGFGIISSVATFVAMARFGRRPIILFGVALAAIFFS